MNCPICGQSMEVYEMRTTYDSARNEFDHKRYRCRRDNVWGRLEIPKILLTQRKPVEKATK